MRTDRIGITIAILHLTTVCADDFGVGASVCVACLASADDSVGRGVM